MSKQRTEQSKQRTKGIKEDPPQQTLAVILRRVGGDALATTARRAAFTPIALCLQPKGPRQSARLLKGKPTSAATGRNAAGSLAGTAGAAHTGYWDRVAGRRLVSELVRLQASAASDAIAAGGTDAWLADKLEARRQLIATLGTLSKGKDWSFAKFTLSTDAVRQFMGR